MNNYRDLIQLALDLHTENNSFGDVVRTVKTILPCRKYDRSYYDATFYVSKRIQEQFAEPLEIFSKYKIYSSEGSVVVEDIHEKEKHERRMKYINVYLAKWEQKSERPMNYLYSLEKENDDDEDYFKNSWKYAMNSVYGQSKVIAPWILNIKDDE
jgi:hypothetical protein